MAAKIDREVRIVNSQDHIPFCSICRYVTTMCVLSSAFHEDFVNRIRVRDALRLGLAMVTCLLLQMSLTCGKMNEGGKQPKETAQNVAPESSKQALNTYTLPKDIASRAKEDARKFTFYGLEQRNLEFKRLPITHKPFACTRCTKTFQTRSTLNRHIETDHATNPIRKQCPFCRNISYKYGCDLMKHLRVIHGCNGTEKALTDTQKKCCNFNLENVQVSANSKNGLTCNRRILSSVARASTPTTPSDDPKASAIPQQGLEPQGCRSSNAVNKKIVMTTFAAVQLQNRQHPSLCPALKMVWPAADDNSDEAAVVERFGNLRTPSTNSPFKDRKEMMSAFANNMSIVLLLDCAFMAFRIA
uniref:C2H2-type domain-containing protein n=1 Tax=Steinernema glaseri TaxID=37863 RepID=A0A1I8AQ93_9BILA